MHWFSLQENHEALSSGAGDGGVKEYFQVNPEPKNRIQRLDQSLPFVI